jgi:serine protease inhibitor ecotin
MEAESLDHRERRLLQLGEAVEKHLDEGWLYFLVIGKPGDPDSTNMICNALPETHQQILELLKTITERYSQGVSPREL